VIQAAQPRLRARFGPVLLASALFAAWPPATSWADPAARIERSIVRILNHSQRGDWYAPWNASALRQSTGSGFVVDGGLVMTNAHVVSDARVLYLYRDGDPQPHEARVHRVGHDCDLALLEPLEAGLLDDVPALRFGGLPRLGSTVETYGFPAGGERISSTRGVVSRIEMNLYQHSGIDYHVAVQTDAAINPGNSGGPVIQDGAVVGVSFQAVASLENVGFFIPTEVVQHFLEDIRDGRYDGYPSLGITTSKLESPAARRHAGMGPDESGVRVDFVFPHSSAEGVIARGDVILAVDGLEVANDATVAVDGLRVHYGVVLDRHQVGGVTRLRVLREGSRLELQVPMAFYPPLSRFANQYDELPRYYVYAGLVFVPLTRETMKTYDENWVSKVEKHLIYEYYQRFVEEPERLLREPVLLLRRLDHPVNANLAWHRDLIVERVNGREIRRLEDVIAALEGGEGEFHEIEFAYYDRFGVIARDAAERAHGEVLERYGVPADRRL
jgi:S1-C subfamily serine protease